MKLTLRKANALQSSINEAIKNIQLKVEVRLNEFQDATPVVEVARESLLEGLSRKRNLNTVLYSVRGQVGKANSESGIDEKLTKLASVEKEIQLYANLSSMSVKLADEVLTGKLDKIRNANDDSRSVYGRSDEVETSVLTEGDVAGFKAEIAKLKKAKQALQDAVLEANIRTQIELTEAEVSLLTKESLL
jgi:hypothetical protein